MYTFKSKQRMGWLPDYPDIRDYTPEHEMIASKLVRTKAADPAAAGLLPNAVDLRQWCPPVEDQGDLGSCTANAGVALVEYFERRSFGKHIDASRLFLYKTTRNLLHQTGDSGAFLRTTMGALVLFGVSPEEYWPYDIENYDNEPPAFCYSFATNYQSIKYFRFDPPRISKKALLERIKNYLASGIPSMFGFTVYDSISQAEKDGKIPYPGSGEQVLGGHAMVVTGYDDKMKIKNTGEKGLQTTGAFLIRNSWGPKWGDEGYGWLPYDYVTNGLAIDWWTLIKNEWVDTGMFGE